jgi:hypothetical protein
MYKIHHMTSISLDQQPTKHWVAKESRNGGLKATRRKAHGRPYLFAILYIKYHTQLGLIYYSDITKSPVYQLLRENNITPPLHMFTWYDSSWDDDHGTSGSTGFLILYQGGVVYH